MYTITKSCTKQELVKELGLNDISTWEQVKLAHPELSRHNGYYANTKEFLDDEICDRPYDHEFVSIDQLPNTQFEELDSGNTANGDSLLTNEILYRIFREVNENDDPVNEDVIYVALALHLTGDLTYLCHYTKWFFLKLNNDYDDGISFFEFMDTVVSLALITANIDGQEKQFSVDARDVTGFCEFDIYDFENCDEIEDYGIELLDTESLLSSVFESLVLSDLLDNSNKNDFMKSDVQ